MRYWERLNTVKHGYVQRAIDWEYSTLSRYVHQGWLPENWGGDGVKFDGQFGE
ncbi:MAG: hypothetical protein PHU06_00590 [Gallionella sp.]|nr:hypothetical protein [Gallionella sp.]MDD4957759.1 hypothetical protein [Gallionella sp.]